MDLKQEMQEDNARDIQHEQDMLDDEKFIEYVIEQVNFNGTLIDIHNELGKWCLHYDNDVEVSDIFEYLKEV